MHLLPFTESQNTSEMDIMYPRDAHSPGTAMQKSRFGFRTFLGAGEGVRPGGGRVHLCSRPFTLFSRVVGPWTLSHCCDFKCAMMLFILFIRYVLIKGKIIK